MIRAIVLCLIAVCFVPEASARLIDQDAAQKVLLTDLLDHRTNRYFAGYSWSRFPKPERSLQIPPMLRRRPLDTIYSRTHAYLYTVQPDDTLGKIARRHATTLEFIKELNRIKSDRLKIGQKLWIPDLVFTIEINKTLNRLYLKIGNVLVKEYPVSTGKSADQTPEGTFFIQSRYPYPTWFHKGVVVSAASADNYLGTRWLGFNKPQFGIHGTIFPELIGQSVSKGCIRMKNEDVEELYEFIPIGTAVTISEI